MTPGPQVTVVPTKESEVDVEESTPGMMTSIAEPDYWALLGLDPGSDADALKRAFRREARRWHPDLNGNDRQAEERFKLVNEAYAVLSDQDRRVAWQQRIPFRFVNNFLMCVEA